MNNINITDELLYRYVPSAEKYYLDQLSEEQVPKHIFSKRFEYRMKKLIRYSKRGPFMKAFMSGTRRIAIAMLILILISFTTIMSVEAYRNRFFEIIKNILEEFTSITFETDEALSEIQFQGIEPQYIPDGFSKSEESITYSSLSVIYSNGKGTDIAYEQAFITNNQIIIDTEDTEINKLMINNHEVEYIFKNDAYQFMWYKDHYAFSLFSSAHREDLIKMIESMLK